MSKRHVAAVLSAAAALGVAAAVGAQTPSGKQYGGAPPVTTTTGPQQPGITTQPVQITTPGVTVPTQIEEQPGQVGGQPAGGQAGGVAGAVETITGALPFTGFQALAILLGGAGIAATGLALRRLGRTKR